MNLFQGNAGKVLKLTGKSIVILFILFSPVRICSQELLGFLNNATPSLTLSTNLLYDASTSLNVGLEFKMAKALTIKLPVTYNPWTFGDNRKIKMLYGQPEIRWWYCEPFFGHFIGLHGHYGIFNVGQVGLGNMKNYRYEGVLYGGGLSYGYDFYLSPLWMLEATVGVGYAQMTYKRYNCETCGSLIGEEVWDYMGLTNIGLSIIYILK
ncbi:MAG: DUF3575 domain-containing protein [Dysgonamonadaceae bacterium]|jgi:hypothetical protein|nr:DUF3575 domain-containing protein [Dysgonamonadaceae bacterium]